ncbi:MAG: efflux RND transporter permease subunit [Planctomycetota bacterium]
MNLTSLALKYKPIVLGVCILFVVWGINTYYTAPRREDPEFIIREAVITTDWPGATPEQVEKLVSDKIEEVCANIKQIRRTKSTSYPGRSVVQVTTVDSVNDVAAAWTKVRAELKLLEPSLPEGCGQPRLDDNFGETAVLVLALYQEPETALRRRYTSRELEVFAKRLRDRILDLRPTQQTPDGRVVPVSTDPAYVMRLDMYGVQQETIYLEADAGRWSQLKLTTETLGHLLSQRNVIAPSGTIDTDSSRVSTRLSGDFDADEEVNRVVVGRVATGGESLDRMTGDEFARQLAIGARNPRGMSPPHQTVPVYLNDLGITVRRQYEDPPHALTRYSDGKESIECIMLSFTMKPGQNIAQLSEAVDRLLATANETFLPPDIVVSRTADPPLAVDNKVNEVVSNLIESITVVLVVLIVLAGFRVAFVTAASIPMIMLSTLGIMRLFGIQIEQISLAALIVALGLLVDNATVVCDNTNRYLRMGFSQVEAAIKGPSEVSTSLLMSTLTTVSVFIPMTFCLTGGSREYVYSLPIVVTIALLGSWLFALTVTAIMNRYLLVPNDGRIPIAVWFQWLRSQLTRRPSKEVPSQATEKPRLYVQLCLAAIRLRWITVPVFFALLIASMFLPIKSSFFPDSDRPTFVIDVYLPEGTAIHRTNEVVRRVEDLVGRLGTTTWQQGKWTEVTREDGEVASRLLNTGIFVGTGGPRFFTGLDPGSTASNYSILWVNLQPGFNSQQYIADLRRATWQGVGTPGQPGYLPPIAGARVIPKALVMGTPVPSPIEYRLLGPRLASEKVLRHFGDEIKQILLGSGLVWDVHDSWGELGEQLNVDIRNDQANMAGVTNATVAKALNAYYTGDHLTTYREGDHQIPIKLRLPPEQRRSLKDIGSVYVEGYSGKVPLDAVAELEITKQPIKITRYQRERMFAVMCRPETGVLARDVLKELEPQMRAIEASLPSGYRLENGGIEEEAIKGERQNAASLSVGAALIALCLIVQYNSWVKPLIIILTVPLSIIGGLVGLYLLNIPMGFMETLGFLALFGTVMNAAILMVDFSETTVEKQRESGEGVAAEGEPSCSGLTPQAFQQCLAEAGQIRLMPIIMTTLTTIGGLLSLILSGGPLFKGLATVFAFGLAIGTAITLFALPAILAIFVQDFGMKLGKSTEAEE